MANISTNIDLIRYNGGLLDFPRASEEFLKKKYLYITVFLQV